MYIARNRVSSNRISNDARTVKKPGFWGAFYKPGIGCIAFLRKMRYNNSSE
jgi:hypothetical protein